MVMANNKERQQQWPPLTSSSIVSGPTHTHTHRTTKQRQTQRERARNRELETYVRGSDEQKETERRHRESERETSRGCRRRGAGGRGIQIVAERRRRFSCMKTGTSLSLKGKRETKPNQWDTTTAATIHSPAARGGAGEEVSRSRSDTQRTETHTGKPTHNHHPPTRGRGERRCGG